MCMKRTPYISPISLPIRQKETMRCKRVYGQIRTPTSGRHRSQSYNARIWKQERVDNGKCKQTYRHPLSVVDFCSFAASGSNASNCNSKLSQINRMCNRCFMKGGSRHGRQADTDNPAVCPPALGAENLNADNYLSTFLREKGKGRESRVRFDWTPRHSVSGRAKEAPTAPQGRGRTGIPAGDQATVIPTDA